MLFQKPGAKSWNRPPFLLPYYSKEQIDLAHANGILCNYFSCDDPAHARRMLELGIDTVLTDNYFQIARERDLFLAE